MRSSMLRLDALLRRRRRVVLALWLVAFVAALPFAARQSDHLTGGGYQVAGSQSTRVNDAAAGTPAGRRDALAAVIVPGRGATDAAVRAGIDRLARAVAAAPDVALAPAARRRAAAAAGNGRTVIVPLSTSTSGDGSIDTAIDLRKRLGISSEASSAVRGGVAVHVVGQGALWAGMQDRSKSDLASAEKAGFPLVAIVLLVVFGSFAAAALPLALAIASVAMTGALIYALSLATEMSVFVTNMASMIGIGVAVDYSLFVLARFREEVRSGRSPAEARATALATSGLAVAFSGATVAVSLAGLFLVGTTAIRSMALGAILVVAVSVLASSTLLPVLIGLLGTRAHRRNRAFAALGSALRSRRRRRPGSTAPDADRRGFWARWTDGIMRRPVAALLAAAALLGALCIPAFSLQIQSGALRELPGNDETRQGFEAAAAVAGPGSTTPVSVMVGGAGRQVLHAVRAAIAGDPEVARVSAPVPARPGSSILLATPRHDGESPKAKALVSRLRARLPRTAGARDARIDVGGPSATQLDFRNRVSGSLWKVALFVLGLSYIVLLVLLRSVILPLKAVALNLLSVGAAYGVLVAVFQWGWADGLFGFHHQGSIDSLTPPLVLAVVFGLSMDYEVFLLTRIRERFDATGSTNTAVAGGLASSAGTITSAALIMVAVFGVFAGTGLPAIKQLGLGCAVAIALDATIVRLVLVPAAMKLLDSANWWLPRPLGRLLPRADFEGAGGAAPTAR